MKTDPFPLASEAERLLSSRFARLREPSKKLASFVTANGRQIALALERRDAIYIWAEHFENSIDGVSVNNQKRPGMPYMEDQTRSSAVNSLCSRLAFGRKAWYLRCDTIGSLQLFADWYASI